MARKYYSKVGDESFSKKEDAIMRRRLLNDDIKRHNKAAGYITINLNNRVLKGRSGYIVRAFSIKSSKIINS